MALKPWVLKSNPLPNNLSDVVHDGVRYLAVGSVVSGEGPYTLTSLDGDVWNKEVNLINKGSANHLAHGGGTFCFLQPDFFGSADATVSTDGGKTWTGHDTGLDEGILDMIRAGPSGRFVAVGASGDTMNSLDGKTGWVRVDPPGTNVDLNGIASNSDGSIVVAIGNDSVPDSGPHVIRSVNQGQAWTSIDPLVGGTNHMNGLCHTGTQFVAVGDLGQIMRSTDGGLTWTKQFAPVTTTSLKRVHGTDKLLVAAGLDQGSGKGPLIIFSENGGVTWIEAAPLGVNVDLLGVVVNGVDVVVVGKGNGIQGTIGFTQNIPRVPLHQRKNSRLDQLSDRIRRRLLTERGSFVYNPDLGSNLHLLTRAKNLDEVYALAEIEVRSALRPEIQKGHILDISAIRIKEKTLHTVSLEIDILANNRERLTIPILIS